MTTHRTYTPTEIADFMGTAVHRHLTETEPRMIMNGDAPAAARAFTETLLEDRLKGFTVPELRAYLLAEHGMKVTGKRADVVEAVLDVLLPAA